MLETIFWIVVGLFIGWNLPQPAWAADLTNKVKNFFGQSAK